MSATVEASRFSNYFGNCPVVSVPGRTYPVHVQYLDDVLEDTGKTISILYFLYIDRLKICKRICFGRGFSVCCTSCESKD